MELSNSAIEIGTILISSRWREKKEGRILLDEVKHQLRDNDNLTALPPTETTESFSNALSVLIRRGARPIIAQAVEAELKDSLAQYRDRRDE